MTLCERFETMSCYMVCIMLAFVCGWHRRHLQIDSMKKIHVAGIRASGSLARLRERVLQSGIRS